MQQLERRFLIVGNTILQSDKAAHYPTKMMLLPTFRFNAPVIRPLNILYLIC